MDNTGRTNSFAWASWVNVVLGIWLIIAPFVLGYVSAAGVWNDIILGIIVAVVAYWSTQTLSTGPSWWNVVMGIWLIIAPFALNYPTGRAVTNDVIVGILVGVFALVAALGKAQRAPGGGYSSTSAGT